MELGPRVRVDQKKQPLVKPQQACGGEQRAWEPSAPCRLSYGMFKGRVLLVLEDFLEFIVS